MSIRILLPGLLLAFIHCSASAQSEKEIASLSSILTTQNQAAAAEKPVAIENIANEHGIFRIVPIGSGEYGIAGVLWKGAESYGLTIASYDGQESSLEVYGFAYRLKKSANGSGILQHKGQWYVQDHETEPGESIGMTFADPKAAESFGKTLSGFLKELKYEE